MIEIEFGRSRRAKILRIIEAVAWTFGCEAKDLLGPSRRHRDARARFCAMAILHHHPSLWRGTEVSLPRIGRIFCRDHTTVLHGLRRYASWCEHLGVPPGQWDGIAGRAHAICVGLGYPAVDVPDLDAIADPASDALPRKPPDASSDPPPSIPDPPAPEQETPMPTPAALLPPMLGCDLFEPLDADALGRLTVEERREAMMLLEDRLTAEHPRLDRGAVLIKIAAAFGLDVAQVDIALRFTPTPYPAAGLGEADDAAPAPRAATVDGEGEARAFTAFAQIHLTSDPAASFDVAMAYARFAAFCRSRRDSPMPRTSFGVALRGIGGLREGPRILGLRLRDAAPAVAAE